MRALYYSRTPRTDGPLQKNYEGITFRNSSETDPSPILILLQYHGGEFRVKTLGAPKLRMKKMVKVAYSPTPRLIAAKLR